MRVAVLSDIHSNLVALDAVLAAAGAIDAVWHLGDVVGYGPDPDGVVDRLRATGAAGVRGNHDAAAAGLLDLDWFNPDARRAIEWTRATASARTGAWLGALPEHAEIDGCELVHGSLRDPTWEYVTSAPAARASMALMTTSVALHGHTHVPIAFIEDEGRLEVISPGDGSELELRGRRALINPGSVGQPRDGDPDASFLLLDLPAGRITWRRVAYEIEPVQSAMRAAGLPPALAARLSLGL